MKVLVTGGCGYIGSHTCIELLNKGYDVIVVDNLINSQIDNISRVEEITGRNVKFYRDDINDKEALRNIFRENKIDIVIHFAGYKAVGESVAKPLMYYRNNIDSTLSLLETMNEFGCKNLVFSSSSTVYGKPKKLPIKENYPLNPVNPYGKTKAIIEGLLSDLYNSDKEWNIIILRYFNAVGAHESGLIGDNPNGIPNNLMPYIVKVATHEIKELSIFGNDYNTPDGTGVRDYIHVVDVARGHVLALDKLKKSKGLFTYNLGTGFGYSVLDVIDTFEKVNGVNIKYRMIARRPGDVAELYADTTLSERELGFTTTKTLEDMCRDAYNYAINNQ